MKLIFTLCSLLFLSTCFSQWTRVEQLPATDIYSLFRNDSVLYAGGNGIIYTSKGKGQSWDSTTHIPSPTLVNAVIIYKNEIYAASYSFGVFKSRDGGSSWQNIGDGIFPYVSEFCVWRGNLYASTLGEGVFKLDSINRNRWISTNNGLSSLSANLNSIAGNNRALIAGTLANGIYDRLPGNSTQWDERYLLNRINPTEGVLDIVTGHDTLFLAGYRGFYYSTDDGITWIKFGTAFTTTYINLLNTKQALLLARNVFNGSTNNTTFYYVRKDSFQNPFIPFSSVVDHFTYRMEILGDKLWNASSKGLYFMSLSDLPGISPADENDTVANDGPNVITNNPPPSYPFSIGEVYPNPAGSEARLILSLDKSMELSASLFDITGKLVSTLAEHQQVAAGSTIFTVKMANLSAGIYFLKLYIGNQVFTRKMIHVF